MNATERSLTCLSLHLSASLFLYLFIAPSRLNAGTALLWIPRGHDSMESVVSRLETDQNLKLTAALDEIPAGLAERIKDLSSQKRLELAARPQDDPVIPLFYYPREESVSWANKSSDGSYGNDPFFLSLRMSDAREAYVKNLGLPPEAFVSPPGGLVSAYIPLAKALGFKWLAAGVRPASSASFRVIDSDGVKLVLFSSAPPSGAMSAPYAHEFIVFDETLDGRGEGAGPALLAFLSSASHFPLMTVSEALETAVSTSAPAAQAAGMDTRLGPGRDRY